ncbi:MAG TPA: hypothetical protein VHC63_05530 [Acidimicrobiales bacterium]|nr:hypothetical protein [Acidimicrobiales bacterium]
MPTLSFEGETHAEIVRKVRRWLVSLDQPEEVITSVEAVERASEITKDALTVIAQSAPAPVRQSELFKALTRLGYQNTEMTKKAVINALDNTAQTQDGVVRRIEGAGRAAVYEMNAAVAKQILKALRPR